MYIKLKLDTSLEAVVWRCSVKKSVFLEISQNSRKKSLCQSFFINKLAGLSCRQLSEKETQALEFLRTPFLQKPPMAVIDCFKKHKFSEIHYFFELV